ncbi:NEDD8-activating enzyme E1 regulatory subunit [Hordeum vulgare]|nr:NEDD8-activating enzyme E1 regulatory subunit [Hordeum vulgare]
MTAAVAAAAEPKTKYDRQLSVPLSEGVTNTKFSLLQLPESSLLKLDSICRSANIVLVTPRSYGLTGLVRVSVKDLIRAHMLNIDEENYKEAVESSYKVSATPGISNEIQQIIGESSSEVKFSSSDFWVLVAALKEFIANEGNGELPLEGTIPDMTSLTEYYVSLQKIYQAKAESDCLAMEHRLKSILKLIGINPESISRAYIKFFCKNTRKLKVCRYRSMEEEFSSPALSEVQKYFADEDSCYTMNFYVRLRVVDRLAAAIADYLEYLTEDLVTEVCRFAGAEIHPVATFIGGVASQEVIKLVTKQFVPLNGTFVFNGIDLKSQILAL